MSMETCLMEHAPEASPMKQGAGATSRAADGLLAPRIRAPCAAGTQSLQRVIDAFRARMVDNVAASARRIVAAKVPFYLRLTAEALHGALHRAFELAARDLEHGAPREFLVLMTGLGTERSEQGVAVVDIMTGLNIGFQVVSDDFEVHFADDLEARLFWEQGRARLAYAGASALADAYLAARERVVRAQSDEIVQLSTRVLPLYPGVLVFPLIGRIAAERAEQITQVLLEAVSRHRCKFALIDVSGLASVDAEVASHLQRAAQAVALLGASPVFVGVTPAAARTMVEGGVGTGRISTRIDLESGLRHALAELGVTLVEPALRTSR